MITQKKQGLTQKEASDKLREFGYNELPADKSKSFLRLIWSIATEPMIGLLISCSLVYLFIGDKMEALILLFSVFFVISLTLYQEKKSEKSLEALRNLSSPRAIVIRDGSEIRIPGREVVPGDMVVLVEGDRVPADGMVLEATNLKVDESHITGESVAVEKFHQGTQEENSQLYSGSLVVKGRAIAQITRTGRNSHVGKIGQSLVNLNIEKTLLQKEVARFVKYIAILGLSLSTGLVIVYYVVNGSLVEGFLAGLTLAIGILPEEMPIVLILLITMGAWRLAKNNVLARRAATIETLGAATVLCVDKTGTLTQNKMAVEQVFQEVSLDIKSKSFGLDEVTYYAALACQRKPFDPMESAILDHREKVFGDLKTVYKDMKLIFEYPLENNSLAMLQAWKSDKGDKYEVAAKGAPEAIFDLCNLKTKERVPYLEQVDSMAKNGLRVLGVAKGEYIGEELPEDRNNFEMNFVGLVALADPVRREVRGAVRECLEAGIRVVMITGDYPATAEHIASKIGLVSPGGVLTGLELERLSDKKLKDIVGKVNIYSRVLPEHKLRIVELLKKSGEIVAMTGDGVNDAPALKSANIGVSMGLRGTDVAREASAIVLLNDNFSSIVGGVRLGRRIYDNLKKAMKYIFSIHVPIAGLSLLPVVLGEPLILMPVHIVFLEFLIDPACTIVFENEPEEKDIMGKNPRNPKLGIFSKKMISESLIEGLYILIMTFGAYIYTLNINWAPEKARGFVFLVLVISNLSLILANRSETDLALKRLFTVKNNAFYLLVTVGLFVMLLVYNNSVMLDIFRFTSLSLTEVFIAVGLGFVSIMWLEIVKIFRR